METERYRATAEKKNSKENSTEEAKGFIASFIEYIRSGRYKITLDKVAKKFSLPPNKLAHNFFTKILGIISDVSHIVINVVSNVVDTVLSALCMVLRSAVSIVTNVANSLATLITFRYTNNECADI